MVPIKQTICNLIKIVERFREPRGADRRKYKFNWSSSIASMGYGNIKRKQVGSPKDSCYIPVMNCEGIIAHVREKLPIEHSYRRWGRWRVAFGVLKQIFTVSVDQLKLYLWNWLLSTDFCTRMGPSRNTCGILGWSIYSCKVSQNREEEILPTNNRNTQISYSVLHVL